MAGAMVIILPRHPERRAGQRIQIAPGQPADWNDPACPGWRGDMVRMSMSDEWREIAVHRSAGLDGQLNIETVLSTEAMNMPWLQPILTQIGGKG